MLIYRLSYQDGICSRTQYSYLFDSFQTAINFVQSQNWSGIYTVVVVELNTNERVPIKLHGYKTAHSAFEIDHKTGQLKPVDSINPVIKESQ